MAECESEIDQLLSQRGLRKTQNPPHTAKETDAIMGIGLRKCSIVVLKNSDLGQYYTGETVPGSYGPGRYGPHRHHVFTPSKSKAKQFTRMGVVVWMKSNVARCGADILNVEEV